MRVGTTIATLKDFTVVTPLVQTATSSHRTSSDQSHHSPYERLLAVGLGVALALVAALALMVPTSTSGSATASAADAAVTAVQTTALGKATPRTTSAATTGGGSTSVE
jgi:hypothetical protein